MKKILLTGSTGFIGRNILHIFNYEISTPTRSELNLLDDNAVKQYVSKGNFDAIVHLAGPTGHNKIDDMLFENSLRVFSSLSNLSSAYGKMIYIGSGAEYGKHRPIVQIKEESYGEELPKDNYGLSRFIMNELAEKHSNIVNLRLFGCHGFSDRPHKLIPSVISQAHETVYMNQDCWFDFLYVKDIAPVIMHFIENDTKFKSYNLCHGKPILISEIAKEVCRQMGVTPCIKFKQKGLNNEYTASNERIKSEIPHWHLTTMEESISEILKLEGLK